MSNSPQNQPSTNPTEPPTQPSVPTQPPADITSRKKKGFPWSYVILTLIIIPLLSFGFAKWYFSFNDIKPWQYKALFYTWRVSHSDKLMFCTTWKFIQSNRYKEGSDLAKLVEKMQTNGLLFDGHPEHFPRGFKHYGTHQTDHVFNEEFLKLRSDLSKKCDDPLEEDVKQGKTEFNDKKMMFWVGKKLETKERVDIFKKYKMLNVFMFYFHQFLRDLHKDSEKNVKVGDTVPESLTQYLEDLCALAKVEVSKEFLQEVPVLMGKIKSPVLVNFAYSRLVYLFYFYTLHVELPPKEGKKKGSDKLTEVSICFATIIANGWYDENAGKGEKDEGAFKGWLKNKMGPQKVEIVDKKENIEKLLNGLGDFLTKDLGITDRTIKEYVEDLSNQ